MDVHTKPIRERIEWLFDFARKHSAEFSSPAAQLARARHEAQHSSAIVALKCMDGRINMPLATKTPMGIIQPFRNIGGRFDLGWPHLSEVLSSHVQGLVQTGRRVVILITYHFSKGDTHRGCAGFHYDTAAAIAHTRAIKEQVEQVFGRGGPVHAILCGFETDEDAISLESERGSLDVARLASTDDVERALSELFPDLPSEVRRDLEPLVIGNFERVQELRRAPRSLDIEHREWMMCVGRGFDFLHVPNMALIIGPYSPNLAEPITIAASIIEANMKAGRIPDDGFLLLASSPYLDVGVDRERAALKARFLGQFAADVIAREKPALAKLMMRRTTVLDARSRALELPNL